MIDSGEYRIVDGTLNYQSRNYGSWEIPISEITLIGEYTNEDGPFADDYFLVFLGGQEPGWLESSFYGEGRDEALKQLSVALGAELSCELAHSTTFTSRILWPAAKMDEQLFKFQPAGPFKNRQSLRNRNDR